MSSPYISPEDCARLEAAYGREFLIYANLWDVENRVSADDSRMARNYRMKHLSERLSREKYGNQPGEALA